MLLVQVNLLNVNLFELGVKNAGDNDSSSFEAMHQIGPVEPVHDEGTITEVTFVSPCVGQ